MSKYRAFIDECRHFDKKAVRTHTQEFNTFKDAYKWLESFDLPHSLTEYYANKRISLITKNHEQ